MNGRRMNQFVAPTRRMIPISLRRANTAMRTVLAMRAIADSSMTIEAMYAPVLRTPATASSLFRMSRWSTIRSMPGWP